MAPSTLDFDITCEQQTWEVLKFLLSFLCCFWRRAHSLKTVWLVLPSSTKSTKNMTLRRRSFPSQLSCVSVLLSLYSPIRNFCVKGGQRQKVSCSREQPGCGTELLLQLPEHHLLCCQHQELNIISTWWAKKYSKCHRLDCPYCLCQVLGCFSYLTVFPQLAQDWILSVDSSVFKYF